MEQNYIGVKPLCNFGGLVILDIEYGVDDHCRAGWDFGNGLRGVRRHKIQTTPSGRNYFWKGKSRHYLDEFIRVG